MRALARLSVAAIAIMTALIGGSAAGQSPSPVVPLPSASPVAVPTSIVGVWYLASMDDTALPAGTNLTVTFTDAGSVTAAIGCTHVAGPDVTSSGSYSVSGNSLSVGQMNSVGACTGGRGGLNQIFETVVHSLVIDETDGSGWSLDSGVLSILSKPRLVLQYTPVLPPAPITGTTPAFSMVLGPAWVVGTGDALVQATSSSGATLVLANGAVPPEASYDEYVTRVEAGLEAAAGTDLATTFRKTGSGVLARIETTVATDLAAGVPPTSLFLFPACADGARTLTITGTSAEATTAGGPDDWDQIAATVDACSSDPAPALDLDPDALDLGVQYLGLVADWSTRTAAAYKPLEKGGASVKVWNKQMKKVSVLQKDFMDKVAALHWTSALQPLVDAWLSAQQPILLTEQNLSREKTVSGIDTLSPTLDAARVAANAPAGALRLEMGLATRAR